MDLFIKRPVQIEAVQFTNNNEPDDAQMNEICAWINERAAGAARHDGTDIYIGTPEGEMRAGVGDWIIKGVQGEFYPCKPEIFAATYLPCQAQNQDERDELGLPPVVSVINDPETSQPLSLILWQNGPIKNGRNGLTLEDVLDACAARLEKFNETKFKCRENSLAVTYIEIARNFLLQRTRKRRDLGVEGTLQA